MAFSAFERQDLVTRISDTLAKAIVEGRLSPGSRLNEVRLAREFDTSRAPLREALRRLESQGLIEAHPRRGFFLRRITSQGLAELFEVRAALERAAGIRATRTLTQSEIKTIDTQFELLRDTAQSGNIVKTHEEDVRLHRLVCEAAGNQKLLRVFDQITNEIRFGRVHLQAFQRDPVAVADAHASLVEALRTKDSDRWAREIDGHMTAARDAMITALELEEQRKSPEAP